MLKPSKKLKSELLDNLYIAAPCSVSWEAMTGDDRARACNMCSRKVYNISDMTRKEANAFLQEHGVSQCLSFYRREDGTIMTDDCPVGLRKLRDRCKVVAHMVTASLAFFLSSLGCYAQQEKLKNGLPPTDISTFKLPKGLPIRMYGEPGSHQPIDIIDERPFIETPMVISAPTPLNMPPTPKFTRGIVAVKGDPSVVNASSNGGPKGAITASGSHRSGTGSNDESGNNGRDPYYKLKAVYNEMADPTAYNLFLAGERNFKAGKILVARAYYKASLKAFNPANSDWKLKQLVEEQLRLAEQATPSSTDSEEDADLLNVDFPDEKARLIFTK